MRVFTGISLGEADKRPLLEISDLIREHVPDWRSEKWVGEENLHVTLKFLGDLPDESAEDLLADLTTALHGERAFAMSFSALVRPVPSARRATMLWAPLDDAGRRAARLMDLLDAAFVPWGVLPEHREFRPHVTLCRARRPHPFPHDRLIATLPTSAGERGPTLPCVSVREVTLFASELSRRGPTYRRLGSATLAD